MEGAEVPTLPSSLLLRRERGQVGKGPRGASIDSQRGSGAFARYEVVGERMPQAADASHTSISRWALSPELRAHKSSRLLPSRPPLFPTLRSSL